MSRKKEIGVCRNCGKQLPYSAQARGKPFCCNHCRNMWRNNLRGNQEIHPVRDYGSYRAVCFLCGREFETHGRGQRYCSIECQREDCGKGKA